MTVELPEISEIERWSVKDGDRLIVHYDGELSMEQADDVRKRVRAALQLPLRIPILVLDQYWDVEVQEIP